MTCFTDDLCLFTLQNNRDDCCYIQRPFRRKLSLNDDNYLKQSSHRSDSTLSYKRSPLIAPFREFCPFKSCRFALRSLYFIELNDEISGSDQVVVNSLHGLRIFFVQLIDFIISPLVLLMKIEMLNTNGNTCANMVHMQVLINAI